MTNNIRLECIRVAQEAGGNADDVIERAKKYLEFIQISPAISGTVIFPKIEVQPSAEWGCQNGAGESSAQSSAYDFG